MSDIPQKKLKLKTPSPAEYARYLGKIRAEAVPEVTEVTEVTEIKRHEIAILAELRESCSSLQRSVRYMNACASVNDDSGYETALQDYERDKIPFIATASKMLDLKKNFNANAKKFMSEDQKQLHAKLHKVYKALDGLTAEQQKDAGDLYNVLWPVVL